MAGETQDDEPEIQGFILARELAAVYLLMDHISASPSKDIPASFNDPVFKHPSKTWIEQICEIAWPPEKENPVKDANNAAKLIRAKDALNKAAAPATGGSIAFTLMIAGEARDPNSGSWWKRTLMWMADVPPNDPSDPTGPREDLPGATADRRARNSGWRGGKAPSRASLAALAYPALSRRAWRYRAGLYALLGFLIVWLLVTCMVSWDVATGSSLLNRVTALDSRVTTLGTAVTPATPASGRTAANAPAPSSEELRHAIELKTIAARNLAKWMQDNGAIREWLVSRMGGDLQKTYVKLPPASGTLAAAPRSTLPNVEWAAAMLGILASNILPIFYGLLGAGAAVVRNVSVKMRDSLLAPRDILLAYVQLALGAVIGACIGLFVISDGDAASEGGLLGSVPLSASALCFVAGFGVEGVFQALESFVRRVFNLDPPRSAP